MRRLLRLLPLPFVAASVGCNPLIYDKLLQDVYVTSFQMRGPTGAPVHGNVTLTFGPDEAERGHVLMAGPDHASMVWLGLSAGGEPVEAYPSLDDLQALIFPLDGVQKVDIGGLAHVPPPGDGNIAPHAIAVFRAPGEPQNARVVRFELPTFFRSDDDEFDIVNPMIDGSPVPKFGAGLAAINLDGPQSDPDFEVAIGSEAGVLVYDDLGLNAQTYQDAKDALDPAACLGVNEPDCFFFTLCDDLPNPSALSQGRFLTGNDPAIVVSNDKGLTFIVDKDPAETNAVGAPVFECRERVISAPEGASLDFGKALFVTDLNGDGNDDLAVGDPGANRVHLYFGTGDGLPDKPTLNLDPGDEDAAEFGFSIGRADLGTSIGSVLVVGAPGSMVGGEPEVGKVFVYEVGTGGEPIVVLEDTTPSKNTRYGIWAGGIHVDGRDELVVTGIAEAKVHVAVNEEDPHPG